MHYIVYSFCTKLYISFSWKCIVQSMQLDGRIQNGRKYNFRIFFFFFFQEKNTVVCHWAIPKIKTHTQ